MIPEDSRFESDPEQLLPELPGLPDDWVVDVPEPSDPGDVAQLTALLRAHESAGRGWAGAGEDDVLAEVSEEGLRTRSNVVARDGDGVIRAWGSVHDRAGGRMLFVHVVERDLDTGAAGACSQMLFDWATAQGREVGAGRGLAVQQIDTGTFEGDRRQAGWLREAGFERVRSWWQMSRSVQPAESSLVPDPQGWERAETGVGFRLVRAAESGMPDEEDLRRIHDVLEQAFLDHFNSWAETFEEFIFRLREEPGHRWDHWWLAELLDGDEPEPVGALVGSVSESSSGTAGSYVSYIGVREAARGRGVAKGLLQTIIADAATRGRDRVGLEVDADSSTGADGLYTALGWKTTHVTESWHLEVPVTS